jgi:hypothetical protein
MSERSVDHATFVVERSYDAAVERAFAAWSDREAKARWFGSPEGRFELDFRLGGRELHQGIDPDGNPYTFPLWSSGQSATALASSSPSRPSSSTATTRVPGASAGSGACSMRWASRSAAPDAPTRRRARRTRAS